MAAAILHQLVTDPKPVEFATELMMPFTMEMIRDADDPMEEAQKLAPGRFSSAEW